MADDEEALTMAVVRLASRYGRYGYRRVTAMPDEVAQSARRYDAVIFDLYGTLIDLPDTQEQGRARMANTLGIEVDRFLEAWGRFRLQRDKGLLTVEESIVATIDYLGVVVESDAIRAARSRVPGSGVRRGGGLE